MSSKSRSTRSTSRRAGGNDPVDPVALATMWRRTVDAVTPEVLLEEIVRMEPSRRRFVLGVIGARDATHPNRAMAAQLMARLRSTGSHDRELVGAVCLQGVAAFSHDLDAREWAAVAGHDHGAAIAVLAEHPELTFFLHDVATTADPAMRRLHLLGGVTWGKGRGQLIALGLLGEFDPAAEAAYASAYRTTPDLPTPAKLSEISPAARAAQHGSPVTDGADGDEVHAHLVNLAEEHLDADDRDHLAEGEALGALVRQWDELTELAQDIAADLEAGDIPDAADAARLLLVVTELNAAAGEHEFVDRAGLERAYQDATATPEVAPVEPHLLRLLRLEGPADLPIGTVVDMAAMAAYDAGFDPAPLTALLDVIDAATARSDGQDVDLTAMVTAQAAAMAGLADSLAPVVFAAGAGLLTVPPTEPHTAAPAQSGGRPAAPPEPEPADVEPEPAQVEDAAKTELEPTEDDDTPADADAAPTMDIDPEATDAQADPGTDEGIDQADETVDTQADTTADADSEPLPALPGSAARYLAPAPTAPTPPPAPVVDVATERPSDEVAGSGEPDEPTWGDQRVAATDADLIGSGRYGLAATLARAVDAPPSCVAARLVGAYAADLRDPVGDLATAFSAHATAVSREDLGDDRAGQLLSWAAAAKVALLAPSAGPAEVLTNLTRCVEHSTALTEVSGALIEAARSGIVVVAPEAAAVAGAASAAHARAKDLADKATDLATRAKHRTLKYLPAGDVYNAWLAPGGALHDVLATVRANDPSKVGEVSTAIVERLRGRAERNIDTVFSALRPKGRSGRIVAQPRQQLAARWDEIVDLAAEWVATREEILALESTEDSGTWHAGALSRLRQRIAAHRDAALRDLAAMVRAEGIPEDAPAGPVRLLTDAFDACDGVLPDGDEPTAAWLERGELLTLPVALDATTLHPDDPAAVTVIDVLDLAGRPVPEASHTYATLAARGAHDLTEALLTALATHDPDTAATLTTTRTRDVFTRDEATRDQLAQLAADIDMRRVDGVLGDDLWARAASQAEALAQPGRRDYERITTAVTAITADLDREREARIGDALTSIAEQAAADQAVAAHADTLAALARAGQVTSAQEQLQQLLEGNPLTTGRAEATHLEAFFPAVPAVLSAAQAPLERINQALRTGGHTDVTLALADRGVDVLALTEPRRKQAREALAAWIELSSPAPVTHGAISDLDRVRMILRQAGIEFRTMGKVTGARDRSAFTLEGVEVIGNALTPALGSERSPDGKLRVVAVRKAATPASLIESLSAQTRDRTILVLWLAKAPLTPSDWHAIAEASRGRPNPPVIFIDVSVMAYLCAQAEPRLSTLASVTLPFAATNPYRDTPGSTAPEMFYGRTDERAQIMDMNGSSFVSGGRQLGKSALLRHAAARFRATSPDHVAIVTSILNVGDEGNPASTVWSKLWPELVEAGIVPPAMPQTGSVGDAVLAAVRAWVKENPARRLLLMLDEADNFLDADAQGNRFEQVELFRSMMLDTDRAVKVVLAGLHRTARFENLPNQPLSHLGRPVVVGPLRPQHARALLTTPLAAIGYTFDSDVTIARVLAQANNMPAQLQLIGQALVAHMAAKAVDPASPPTIITADDVDAAFDQRLREELRNKFLLTLTLDPRYKVIAYVVAQAAHEHGSDTSLSLGELSSQCRGVWPQGFTEVGADGFRGLVAECVDLGVLARDGNRYRLRTPAVRRLLGTELEVLEELESAATNLTMPPAYDGSAFRRRVSALEGAVSPLTERQIGQIFARGGVMVVAGSRAAGLDKVLTTLEEVAARLPHGGVVHRLATIRPESVTAAIAKAVDRTRLLVDARKATHRQLAALLAAAEAATAGTSREVTTVIVAGPASAAAWAKHPATVQLERVGVNGMRLLAGSDVLPFHDQGDQIAATAASGGWLSLIARLTDLAAGPEHRYAADLIDAIGQDLQAHPGHLVADVGLDNGTALRAALAHIADLTANSTESLDDISALLDVVGGEDSALTTAMDRDGYTDAPTVVAALVGLGALVESEPGLWAVEPVLAGDLARSAGR